MATTFTRTSPGTYDPTTDTWTSPVTSTIDGSAIQVRGNPQRYAALGLILATMPTLLFTPVAYGLRAFTTEFVLPGDTVVWNGVTYTAKDIDPVAPDGLVIVARIIVSA